MVKPGLNLRPDRVYTKVVDDHPTRDSITEGKIGFVGIFPYPTMASVASVKKGGGKAA